MNSTRTNRGPGGSRSRRSNSFAGKYSSKSFSGKRGGRRGGSKFSRVKADKLDEKLFIKKAEVFVDKKDEFVPDFTYPELQVDPQLKNNIAKKGYVFPTPVQNKSIPVVMAGQDLLGTANTGTGKTAAFLVPLVQKVIDNRSTKVLILVPTRELAEQIHDELVGLSAGLRIFGAICIGGASINAQIQKLKRGVSFVIATPGRTKDLYKRGALNLSSFNTVVLDEVDRMLDMGFVDEIRFLISLLPKEKQSLFFSATMTKRVEALMEQILRPGYARVAVATGVTAKNINQDVVHYRDYQDKMTKFMDLLTKMKGKKVLVFANTKREVEKLDITLKREGFSIESIHGDKRQNWRRKALAQFKGHKTDVLIATDVAARGLDIQGVALVINYDVPNNHEDYIHRIGRTGRANASGDALTFVKKAF